ncbi:hypothetical protein [Noviherbaspirillum soli]|uniref:hypothetical protein n=1 Tax=Noviherbaspirillum soli TaxID=1064518 RepID=UPI00188D901A|nr:hypothetical protein [Noviherbaspirillum soli]
MATAPMVADAGPTDERDTRERLLFGKKAQDCVKEDAFDPVAPSMRLTMAGGQFSLPIYLAWPWASSPNDIEWRLFPLRLLAPAVATATLQACAAGDSIGTQAACRSIRLGGEAQPPGNGRLQPDGTRFPVSFPGRSPACDAVPGTRIRLRLGNEQILD